jgi:hypothetical protein
MWQALCVAPGGWLAKTVYLVPEGPVIHSHQAWLACDG